MSDGSYELTAFVDGNQITHPFLHKAGTSLFKGRALFSEWAGLLAAEERSDDTLIYFVRDTDGFIDAVGMELLDTDG